MPTETMPVCAPCRGTGVLWGMGDMPCPKCAPELFEAFPSPPPPVQSTPPAPCPVCRAQGPYVVSIRSPDSDALATAWMDEPGVIGVLPTLEVTPVLPAAVTDLLDLLRSPAMGRVLESGRNRAEEDLPTQERYETSLSPAYARNFTKWAAECREEIATVDALRAALKKLEEVPDGR